MEKERCFKGCLKGNKNKCHSKLDLESHRFLKRQQGEILNQVQDDAFFYNNGFTLIELLVVVLIIGILAAVAVPQYQKAVMKSRYATLMHLTKSLAEAERVYYLANGEYTNDFEALAVEPSGCMLSADKRTCTYSWGKCVLDVLSNGSVGCVNTTSLKNAYLQQLEKAPYAYLGRALCLNLTDDQNSKYGKLCEQMGGSYLTRGGWFNLGICGVYRLQ